MQFKFAPLQFVCVTLFDLKYRGRISRCILDDGGIRYSVEYADDKGDLQVREFYEDELEAKDRFERGV